MLNWTSIFSIIPSQPPPDGEASDAELVARAKEDREAFALLYRRYAGRVYRYCYSRLGSREAAEDATSQTFYKVLLAIPHYRPGPFTAWIFTIAHNVVVDSVRVRQPQAPLEAAGDPPDRAPTPEELAVAADERRSLHALLDRLSVEQRRVVQLRLAGLTTLEIATLTERSPAAVKMLQFRALERLRELMGAPTDSGEVHRGTE